MTALIITIVLALSISALCSTMEAMLYSIPWTTLEKMKESGSRSGKILYHMRSNVDQPISAILTLNTIANTAGASLAGALAASALGPENMPYFAALFTVLVLLFGEIIPKTLGVSYPGALGRMLALPLFGMTIVLRPATWLSGQITRLITPKKSGPEASRAAENPGILFLTARSGHALPQHVHHEQHAHRALKNGVGNHLKNIEPHEGTGQRTQKQRPQRRYPAVAEVHEGQTAVHGRVEDAAEGNDHVHGENEGGRGNRDHGSAYAREAGDKASREPAEKNDERSGVHGDEPLMSIRGGVERFGAFWDG